MPGEGDTIVLVNPLHHTNSSAIGDWAVRRPGAVLHLVERYTTGYWAVLEAVARASPPEGRIVAPMVARHFDFLRALVEAGKLPPPLRDAADLRRALAPVDVLIGSAPVGPSTVECLLETAGKLPIVRFGSTETTLQVLGTAPDRGEEARLAAFRDGWGHTHGGRAAKGYYIGRPHPPHTEVRVVRSVTAGDDGFLVPCEEGQPGYLICRGGCVMEGYAGDEDGAMTREAVHGAERWYTKFGDIAFWKLDPEDGLRNYYWLSR